MVMSLFEICLNAPRPGGNHLQQKILTIPLDGDEFIRNWQQCVTICTKSPAAKNAVNPPYGDEFTRTLPQCSTIWTKSPAAKDADNSARW